MFFINILFSQNKMLGDYYKCKIVSHEENSEFLKYTVDSVPELSIYSYLRENEYFIDGDTLKRDFISYKNAVYTIDYLMKNGSDYAGDFQLTEIYLISDNDVKYVVIDLFNLFQMGSDSQGYYIALKLVNNNLESISAYLLDSSTEGAESIEVSIKCNEIVLEHENLMLYRWGNVNRMQKNER